MGASPTNRVVLSLGQKGRGKSYSIKRSLDKLGRHVPVYVWDPNREYAGDAAKDGIRNVDAIYRSWPEFLEAASERPSHIGRVVLQVSEERFIPFCQFARRCGGCTVVIDEAHDYVGPECSQANKAAFRKLLTTSRHRRINLFIGAWRPTDLPTCARHAADEIRAFNTIEVNDLRWYGEAGCGEDFVYRVQRLQGHASITFVRGEVPRRKEQKQCPPGSRTS